MNAPNDPTEVFWQRTQRASADECWTWLGGLTRRGYGVVWIRGKLRKAAHISLELHGKSRPGRSLALHSCDNPACVNPRHLRWGNHQQNADDKVARGRWKGGDPTKRPGFKRTPELVAAVLQSSEGSALLARRLGVSKPTVQRIRGEHGIERRSGPPTVMRDRVLQHLQQRADSAGIVMIKQTGIARTLKMPNSNVNIAIKGLVGDGRLERISKSPTGIWTYRLT